MVSGVETRKMKNKRENTERKEAKALADYIEDRNDNYRINTYTLNSQV